MSDLVLYGNRESGHSYKVALALALLGLTFTYRPVDLALDRAARPEDFRGVSRFGEVPVLIDRGRSLVQSNAILLHLVDRTGRLAGTSGPERLREWLFWEANRIGFSLPNLRFARVFLLDADPTVLSWLEARLQQDLDRLNEEFSRSAFLTGSEPSVADVACCGYMFFAEQAGIDIAAWPHIEGWLDRMRALPGWKHPYDLLT